MACNNLLAFHLLLLAAQLGMTLSQNPDMYPFNCSASINTCSAYLYHINYANPSLSKDQIASYYSVNSSALKPIQRSSRQDYLIRVPCSCQTVNVTTTAYFYETDYAVQPNDTFFGVSNQIYSGQAFPVGGRFRAGRNFTMSLACGCAQSDSDIVVTYTVQDQDTLKDISSLLSATVSRIAEMNTRLLAGNMNNLHAGWVLYVPMEVNGTAPPPRQGE